MSKKQNSDLFCVGDVFTNFDLLSKQTINMRLIDAVVTFDNLSEANLYHVLLMHHDGFSNDAILCFFESVKPICHFWSISHVADTNTRFVVVSHINPSNFERLLRSRIDSLNSNHILSIQF